MLSSGNEVVPTFSDRSPRCGADAPRQTVLYQNVPNPFNPMTTTHFDLAQDGRVTLRIYDVAGRLVRTLVDQHLQRHHHSIVWDGMNEAGRLASSGIYLYKLETYGFTGTRKMIVLR